MRVTAEMAFRECSGTEVLWGPCTVVSAVALSLIIAALRQAAEALNLGF